MYYVSKNQFAQHLLAVDALAGDRVMTLGQSRLKKQRAGAVVITSDDGWAGAFEIAVPMLLEKGWKATFFITRDL
jgi:peptidoglycan/xylan/chitin deacetylase (PgdA/CDA1 family)